MVSAIDRKSLALTCNKVTGRQGTFQHGAKATFVQMAEFKRQDGVIVAIMGVLIILAACAGVVVVLITARSYDLKTAGLVILGFIGACGLGYAFINAWRTPILTVRPDRLTIPTFFGVRDIPITPGHPMGEYLASSTRGSNSIAGTIEDQKFVHFFTLDAKGSLTEVVAMHRAAPQIPFIRRAFQEVAGLKIETLKPDRTAKKPDVSHWR